MKKTYQLKVFSFYTDIYTGASLSNLTAKIPKIKNSLVG
jgi:hypothetical protein